MKGYWYIDGVDITTAYGVHIEKGSADLLRLPPRKEGIVHDWMDQNGKDYDTDNFYFDSRETTLNIGILADSETDYWKKYNAFMAHLSLPGKRRLEITAHGSRQYFFIFKEMSAITQVLPLTGNPAGEVGQKLSFTIIEPSPSATADAVLAISDEQGRIIVT